MFLFAFRTTRLHMAAVHSVVLEQLFVDAVHSVVLEQLFVDAVHLIRSLIT